MEHNQTKLSSLICPKGPELSILSVKIFIGKPDLVDFDFKFLQPDGVNLWYFKFRLFDLAEFIVWNI